MGLTEILSYFVDFRFVLLVFAGALSGLFVGAIPGLSVSMATALLVSITYSWETTEALATIMGIYVVGVFSGALSAILINIPGTPSAVATTLDGFPMAQKGQAHKAIVHAAVYSFIGTLFGLLALWLLAKPIASIALRFNPIDYFLLALFGLTTIGSISGRQFYKAIISAAIGLLISMIGLDSMVGTPRLTFGFYELQAGINTIAAMIGLFGFSEVLTAAAGLGQKSEVHSIEKKKLNMGEVLKHWAPSLYYSALGTVIGALPGAGSPVAAFVAYTQAKKITKNPEVPFGEGAVEGIIASESANNACIGGALIPMLTLAVPGDAVTAIILSVFYIHGLQPGPMFIKTNPAMFYAIIAAGLIGCVFLLLMGLFVAPKMSRIINVPKRFLLPVITVLCVVGSFAYNNRLFDVGVMLAFGVLGYFMKKHNYSVAALTLALVLGQMMDSNFRRAVSLAISEDNFVMALLGRPITIALLACVLFTLATSIFKNMKQPVA